MVVNDCLGLSEVAWQIADKLLTQFSGVLLIISWGTLMSEWGYYKKDSIKIRSSTRCKPGAVPAYWDNEARRLASLRPAWAT